MRFEFATVTRIVFGPGSLRELSVFAPQFGKRALVVTGRNAERAAPALDILQSANIEAVVFSVNGEPAIEDAREGKKVAFENGCDFVIAFGGGSALDAGKAIAALMTNPGDPLDYLEVIGRGQTIKQTSAPLMTIPTTAGTGSEVTSNAVLFSQEHRVKVSLRSPLMLARLALVDSTLTHSAPPHVTAQSGLDALTQVIEPYVSSKANPMTDALCREAIRRGAQSLWKAYENPDDAEARENMSLVSLFGGLALSNAKLGAVHGFAGPFGGMFDAPHGAICARLLPFVTEVNITALRQRQPESNSLRRYEELARLLTGDDTARLEDGAQWLHKICSALQVPPLETYGLSKSDFPVLVQKASVASSMQGNPIKLTDDEMHEILDRAY
jgi:alcohol dehydrogenase class IV